MQELESIKECKPLSRMIKHADVSVIQYRGSTSCFLL